MRSASTCGQVLTNPTLAILGVAEIMSEIPQEPYRAAKARQAGLALSGTRYSNTPVRDTVHSNRVLQAAIHRQLALGFVEVDDLLIGHAHEYFRGSGRTMHSWIHGIRRCTRESAP